jgi:hypothetical protein
MIVVNEGMGWGAWSPWLVRNGAVGPQHPAGVKGRGAPKATIPISPNSAQIQRNWFCLSRLVTIVAVGPSETQCYVGIRHKSCDV